MAKLTLEQLERHLFAAADILRGTMDAAAYRDEFEAARTRIIADEMALGSTREEAEEEADEPSEESALWKLRILKRGVMGDVLAGKVLIGEEEQRPIGPPGE